MLFSLFSFWSLTSRFNNNSKWIKLFFNAHQARHFCVTHLTYCQSVNLTKVQSLNVHNSISDGRRYYSSKQESYFSAIGAAIDDYQADLSPEQVICGFSDSSHLNDLLNLYSFAQVTKILQTNEIVVTNILKSIKSIECNQLGSNNPIEDRIRVSKVFVNTRDDPSGSKANPKKLKTDTLLLAVFDGHGGRLCVDVIARRLFAYIAISLLSNPVNTLKEKGLDYIIQDVFSCPNISESIGLTYDKLATTKIKNVINQLDKELYLNYAQQLQENPIQNVETILRKAFNQCDQDLSNEIETSLLNPSSNVLLHYYLSLAVSGCCVALMLIHKDTCYIASTGK